MINNIIADDANEDDVFADVNVETYLFNKNDKEVLRPNWDEDQTTWNGRPGSSVAVS